MNHRDHMHCIVPPKILEKLLQRPELRDQIMRTMLTGSAMRERRQIIGALPTVAVPGGLKRTIADAQNTANLRGVSIVLTENGAGTTPGAKPDQAAREAFDGLKATYDLFKDVYGRNSIDDKGMLLYATVHYDEDFDNAFWDGSEMVFGDGDDQAFKRGGFTAAIDVIGHELTHGVTEATAGLEYHDQPGALNESVSDVFGSLVKQYKLGQNAAAADWLIGAGILGPALPGVALRSMKAPGTAFAGDDQPANMSGYVHLPNTRKGDYGGVHTNSGIPNYAFYLLATGLGSNVNAWDAPGHIWYEMLRQLWPTAEFKDAAKVSYQVAGAIFGAGSSEQKAVRDAWQAVGVSVSTGHGIPITAADGKAAENGGDALKGQLQRVVQELQRTIELLPS